MDDLESAVQYKEVCDKWYHELASVVDEPLTVDEHGYIKTGVLWIGLTCPPRKVVKVKCVCPSCGSRHTKRG